MSQLKRLQLAAKALNAVVTDNSSGGVTEYAIEAPPGKIWASGGGHFLYVTWGYYGREDGRTATDKALSKMVDGLVDCRNPDCDCGQEKEQDE